MADGGAPEATSFETARCLLEGLAAARAPASGAAAPTFTLRVAALCHLNRTARLGCPAVRGAAVSRRGGAVRRAAFADGARGPELDLRMAASLLASLRPATAEDEDDGDDGDDVAEDEDEMLCIYDAARDALLVPVTEWPAAAPAPSVARRRVLPPRYRAYFEVSGGVRISRDAATRGGQAGRPCSLCAY